MYELPSNIEITEDVAKAIENFMSNNKYQKVGVLVDSNTAIHCYPFIESSLPDHFVINIASGERHKDLNTCNGIWEEMTDHQMDRKSLLINLGGGVIGDMGGFCAATYKRGLNFVNIPTTLLSQVDASIGGKLGVDFQGFKNHIGVFKEPQQVLICSDFLNTLPSSELRSGFAEVIKHALIYDMQYWNVIKNLSWELQPWNDHIYHSVSTKHQIVTQDPQESDIRKILNFGHTIGHAIERHYLHEPEPLLHGEAVAIGMICESFLSTKKEGLSNHHLKEINNFILNIFGKTEIPTEELNAIAKNALQDKKNKGGQIICTLLKNIGQATYNTAISLQEVEEGLDYYCSL